MILVDLKRVLFELPDVLVLEGVEENRVFWKYTMWVFGMSLMWLIYDAISFQSESMCQVIGSGSGRRGTVPTPAH